LVTIYLIVLLISFLCSLISFRLHYPWHLKLFSVLLGLTVVTEFFANYGMQWLWHGKNNMPIYNIYRVFEYTGYALYYRQIIKSRVVQKIITGFLIFYPIYWFITIFLIFPLSYWGSYLPAGGSPFIILFSVRFCYELFISPELVDFKKSTELWIAMSLIIYYTGSLPCEGMLNFLYVNYGIWARKLVVVLDLLNIIMYSFIIYAYLCRINIKKSPLY